MGSRLMAPLFHQPDKETLRGLCSRTPEEATAGALYVPPHLSRGTPSSPSAGSTPHATPLSSTGGGGGGSAGVSPTSPLSPSPSFRGGGGKGAGGRAPLVGASLCLASSPHLTALGTMLPIRVKGGDLACVYSTDLHGSSLGALYARTGESLRRVCMCYYYCYVLTCYTKGYVSCYSIQSRVCRVLHTSARLTVFLHDMS